MSDFKINKKICYIQSYAKNPNFKSKLQTVPDSYERKTGLSAADKTAIGLGITGALALVVELILFKGKHLKNFRQKFKGNKTLKHSQTIDKNAAFKNINEAKEYFESAGIKTVFKDGTENYITDLNNIRNGIDILKKNGVEIQKPDVIIFSDWNKKEELEAICRSLNFPEDAVSSITGTLKNNTGMWGTTESLKNGKHYIFVNNSFGNMSKFLHEMGHIHQDYSTSFWHSRGLTGSAFRYKQYEILGLPKPEGLSGVNTYHNWSSQNLEDIFRADCSRGVHVNDTRLNQKIRNLFPELNGDFETLFFAPSKNNDGKIEPYYINAKKIIDKMSAESKVYSSAKNKIFENAAEIFEGLNSGKIYSDEVMLMYDLCGGGRVPNLVIKGKKYDDYIKSLYENSDLISKLKEDLVIKKLS